MEFNPVPSLSDLKVLEIPELESLAQDLRQKILTTCLANGGHLGASLGTVELAIALHSTFHSPVEPIFWDVGHQAYAHKLLTGRWAEFHTLRRKGGLSGFLSREESEHDVFGAGHSSTSISAAIAAAWARRGSENWTVAVIGDGALTAGLAWEALNQVGSEDLGRLLIVINDNQMSISPNVGAMSRILASGEATKFFDMMGLDYYGPLDGHDLTSLIGALRGLKSTVAGRPIVAHVFTQKGKGYLPAEEMPANFHGMSPATRKKDSKPLEQKIEDPGAAPIITSSYSEIFGQVLLDVAVSDDRVLAITAAMEEGTGLADFHRRLPEQFFDVGIAEPHACVLAAGLAAQGYRPVFAVYSTFLQRALDGVIHDVALQSLPVVFAIDRAGWVGVDGPTHHGTFDLSFLLPIPGLRVFVPGSYEELRHALTSALRAEGPSAIRYPRGPGRERLSIPILQEGISAEPFQPSQMGGKLLVSTGFSAARAEQAMKNLAPEIRAKTRWVHLSQIKPVPEGWLAAFQETRPTEIFVLEDGSEIGGAGHFLRAETEVRVDGHASVVQWIFLAYPDQFSPHATVVELEEATGLSARQIAERLSHA